MLRFKVLVVLLAVATAHPALLAQSFTFTALTGPSESPGAIDGTGDSARFDSPKGVAVDSRGNVYVADTGNNTIRKISPLGAVTTLAGSYFGGPVSTAAFYYPGGVAVDGAGNVYVADTESHTIRKITPAGLVTTIAGVAGVAGQTDGTTVTARFNRPVAVAVDAAGNLYIADQNNHAVRKISSTGIVTTLPGRYVGATNGGDPSKSTAPAGVAVDRDGNVYVAGGGDCVVRKVTPEGFNITLGGVPGDCGFDDGLGIKARFFFPTGIAVDQIGNVWVSDRRGAIRKIDAQGAVTTLAGGMHGYDDPLWSPSYACPSSVAVDTAGKLYVTDDCRHTILTINTAGTASTVFAGQTNRGFLDGTARGALFDSLAGVGVDSGRNVYVADHMTGAIRKITPLGVVTTMESYREGFLAPIGLAMDSSDNLYVTDSFDDTIRKVTPAGAITTIAGPAGLYATPGTGTSNSDVSRNIAIDSSGNLFVSDSESNVIRKITAAGVVSTLAGLEETSGSSDGVGTTARFNYPTGLAADSSGNVYVADTGNATIRRIKPDGTVSTVAGLAGQQGFADGFGSKARFDAPVGLAVSSDGDIYVTDIYRYTIRKVTPGGDVTTVAGDPHGRQVDVDGTGSRALFFGPRAVAVDRSGNLYVTDYGHAVRIGKPTFAEVTDVATIDVPTGLVNSARKLDASSKTATSYQWSVIRRPADSVAEFSSSTIRNPTFTPDVPGPFRFRLVATAGGAMRMSTVDLTSVAILGRRHATGH